jgi:uncharacterized protein YeaO (DUF488 family)
MKIYTSYFANLKTLEENGLYCVSICNKVPSFFHGPNIESVAPNNSILWQYKKSQQTDADRETYKQRYINEVLCAYRFHPEYFTDLLKSFSESEGGKDIALLCYEKPGDFCHRHLLADWLNSQLDCHIEEFPIYPSKKKEKKLEKSNINFETIALF